MKFNAKYIGLSTQKRLMFIPVLNWFILFIYIYNAAKTHIKQWDFIKVVFVCFAIGVPAILLLNVLQYLNIPILKNIYFIYVIPLALALGIIWYQGKLGFNPMTAKTIGILETNRGRSHLPLDAFIYY